MSIAVSALVKPSSLLLAMVAAMCMCTVLAGALLGLGFVSELAVGSRVAVTACFLCIAWAGWYGGLRTRSVWRIDISADGQIRLTRPHVAAASRWSGDLVRLMPDSTLWGHLLSLRLQAEDGRSSMLLVLPDSVSKGEFRALAVACRWVAAQNNPTENDHI
jgi:toxin CptA